MQERKVREKKHKEDRELSQNKQEIKRRKVEIEVKKDGDSSREERVIEEIEFCSREVRKKETEIISDKEISNKEAEDRKRRVEITKKLLMGAIMLEQVLEVYMQMSQEKVGNREEEVGTGEVDRDNVWEAVGEHWIEDNYRMVWETEGENALKDRQENSWDSWESQENSWDSWNSQDNSWDNQIVMLDWDKL